jgi:hypothetical protein
VAFGVGCVKTSLGVWTRQSETSWCPATSGRAGAISSASAPRPRGEFARDQVRPRLARCRHEVRPRRRREGVVQGRADIQVLRHDRDLGAPLSGAAQEGSSQASTDPTASSNRWRSRRARAEVMAASRPPEPRPVATREVGGEAPSVPVPLRRGLRSPSRAACVARSWERDRSTSMSPAPTSPPAPTPRSRTRLRRCCAGHQKRTGDRRRRARGNGRGPFT